VRDVVAALARAAGALSAIECRFAVIGGLAVGARTEPRTTRDIDVAVAVESDAEAEAVVFALRAHGFETVVALEHEVTGRLATARLADRTVGSSFVLDLLFASSGIEPEIVASAKLMQITRSLRLPIATVGHLIVMKLLARDDRRRPADADDLRALRAVATEADWEMAREGATLCVERGFHRGRDLVVLVDELRVTPPW
jgi:predicted nucleotidyltransferase